VSSSRGRIGLPHRIKRADERIARRINARRTGQRSDTFWRTLSTAANRGMLWFAAAGRYARPRA
jgi:hypothetical protein